MKQRPEHEWREMARKLAASLRWALDEIEMHNFSEGQYYTLHISMQPHAYILHAYDDKEHGDEASA